MNLIPYEQFTIDGNALKKLQEHYTNRKIKEYFKNHGVMPNSGTVESFVIPPELMDEYKKYYYADYCQKEVELEKKYGPSEMIETSFAFSTSEGNDSTVLGVSPLRLGASVSGDDEEYQYEYWNIAVLDITDDSLISDRMGSFTTLSGITVPLNSLKEYAFLIYHRKSNYQYGATIQQIPLDNQFHSIWDQCLSYYLFDGVGQPKYKTQIEDKEYVGVVRDYIPQKGGVISGSIYTLNPSLEFTISGLTSGLSIELSCGSGTVIFSCNQDGQLETNCNQSKLTKISNTSFTYQLTKDEIVYKLRMFNNFWGSYDGLRSGIENPLFPLRPFPDITWSGHKADGRGIDGIVQTGDFRTVLRNGVSSVMINIPYQGEDIDTGFDFDIIDD